MSLFDFLGQMGGGGGGSFGAGADFSGDPFGTGGTPMATQSAPNPLAMGDASPMASSAGMQSQLPQIQQPGLLDRLRTPDARGMTFGDKLFSAGSIARGDTQSAMQHMQNRELLGLRQKALDEQTADRQRRSAAFKGAYGADGKFDAGKYAAMSGEEFDPADVARLQSAFRQRGQFMNGGGNGSIYYMDEANPSHPTEVVKGQPKPPGPIMSDGQGGWMVNPEYVGLQEQVAAARRRGAPPVGRSGAAKAPKSYGANEVDWGH